MVTSESQAALGGFRLGAHDEHRTRAPSVSSLSYKQKIDALFDDTRSITSLQYTPSLPVERERRDSKISSRHEGDVAIFEDDEGYCQSKFSSIVNNTVQDRIERMFADMAGESKLTDSIGVHVFNVHYLGSTPLHSKVTSLSGLQTPLRDLYFQYRKNHQNKNPFNGRLEISKNGLKVKYKGDKGDLEQLNPFPTIAVWSAVKFIVQPLDTDTRTMCYAFLPLITDPDNIDRQALFHNLEPAEKKYILSHNENSHSPLFAVVMRKIGVAKQLECHGFVCQTTEDAIVIAATLYKSLMAHMSRQGHGDKKKFKSRNGVSCMSVGSSMSHREAPRVPRRTASSLSADSDRADGFSACESFTEKPKLERTKKISSESLPQPPLPPIIRPAEAKRITVEEVKAKLDAIKQNDSSGTDTQNSKKSSKVSQLPANKQIQNLKNAQSSSESSVRSKVSEKIELFRQLERRKSLQRPPTLPPPIPVKPQVDTPPDPCNESLRRSQSGRKSISESGDILTKVAIPRSGSFLNAGGLTRYKSIGHRNNGKKGGGSPLGFNELFNEFKVQENLHSMDEILSAIIDSEGMSFNDLKPIYKEFLLKLAVTLTKDELFQHSKAIMKKQKKKILRRTSIFQKKGRKIFKGASGLKMVFKLPFGKDVKHENEIQTMSLETSLPKEQASDSSVSTSSYDIRQFHPKEMSPKRHHSRHRSSKRSDKIVHVKRTGKSRLGERNSTSEESDFLTLSNRLGCQNRNSSSGYVSCSECESESCVDRCYCSLKGECQSKCYCSAVDSKDKPRLLTKSKSCKDCSKEYYDADFSYCSCDSESCADSNKCYCTNPRRVQVSHSMEYLRVPSKAYSDRMKRAFDDDKSGKISGARRRGSRSRRARSSEGGTGTGAGGAVGAGGAGGAGAGALECALLLHNNPRRMHRVTATSVSRSVRSSAGSHEALSVKKSAEMAALFADVRLSQRTDVRSLYSRTKVSASTIFNHRPLSRNASLEESLGYLP